MKIIPKYYGDRVICDHIKGEQAGWLSSMGRLEYCQVKANKMELPIVPPQTWQKLGKNIPELVKYIEQEIQAYVELIFQYPNDYIAVKFIPYTLPKWIEEI